MDRREFLGCCCGAAALAAMGGLPRRVFGDPAIERWTRTVCDLCGLNEPVFLGVGGGNLVAVKGIPNSTVGFGRLCPRAEALWAASAVERRATRPMVRRDAATKGTLEGLEPVSWDEAFDAARRGLDAATQRTGPGGLGFLASDGETSETYHLLGKVARGFFGTDNIDTPARLDALHAYDACRDVFGVPGNAASLEDVDAADLIILMGGDLAETHPSLFYRALDSRRAGRSRVILIDPRKTLAAGVADLHLRPRAGHELAVVNAFPGPGRTLRVDEDLSRSDLHAEEVENLRRSWAGARAVTTIVGPGVLSGPAGASVALALCQLHRAAGRWGSPGQGVIFLPKGANAAGVVAHGAAPGRLPADRVIDNTAHREEVARTYGIQPDALPASPGLSSLDWPEAVLSGRMGGMVVLRCNPAAELPGAGRWREALGSAFVVAASTHTLTETEPFADVILPLALAAGETDGTMIALDRRYQLLEGAVPPPGEARTASDILLGLVRSASASAYEERFAGYGAGPHVAMEEWRALSRGTPLDASGIDIQRLRKELGVKWPCLTVEDPGIDRIGPGTASEGRVDEHGAALPSPVLREPLPSAPTPLPESLPEASSERPFLLVGGALRDHFRSRVRTGLTPELHYDAPVARIEMHPSDGSGMGLVDGQWITLASEWGRLSARVWLTDRSPRGLLFIPEHFGFLSDIQGGTETLKEPEGLFHLVTGDSPAAGSGAPAGCIVPVSVRPSRRRDMRRRALRS